MYTTALKWLGLVGGVALLIGAIFFLGSNYKDAQWEAKWAQDKLEYSREITRLQGEVRTKEQNHAVETSRLQSQIAEQARLHTVAIAAVRAEFSQRLRTSEARAGIYQRQAEAGPTQCRDLATHAARLDRSLEEGRGLVQELRLTIGQRDNAIHTLSDQIRADRKLFE